MSFCSLCGKYRYFGHEFTACPDHRLCFPPEPAEEAEQVEAPVEELPGQTEMELEGL
jgi:hypothetical protein